MRKLIITVFVLYLSTTIFPQEFSKVELDSLYNLFTFIKGVNASDKLHKQLQEDPALKKCGMEMVNTINQNLINYSNEQQQILSKILARPQLQTSTVTPGGYFRVHYDLTGNNALGYDLNLLLQALDSAYRFEINSLGYPNPPSDGAEGGDDKYDIYVQNLSGLYGYTQFEIKVTDSRWTSFMVIDNDYVGYYSSGINGARVTVAHEFHHGIQGGNYAPAGSNSPFRNSDVFYYEITSTAFEEFVFDDVNDYYAYMPSYFQNPETAMPLNDGYNLAIWNIYLQNNFGFDILKRQWDLIPSQGSSALKSIALSINEYGSTLGNELNKFGIWTYYTNSRAISGRYFEEANNYPLISPTPTQGVVFSPPSDTYSMSVAPVANYFLKINLPSADGVFYTIVTNSDWQKANDNAGQSLPFTYILFNDNNSGTRVISDNYSATFNNDNQTFWNNAGILNNNVVYGDSNFTIPSIEDETFAYPVPYNLSSSGNIRIVFSSQQLLGEEVNLSIFSAGLDLYFSGNKIIQSTYLKNGKTYCEIILDKNDATFLTGVYIYFIKTGTDIFKGKLVIFND